MRRARRTAPRQTVRRETAVNQDQRNPRVLTRVVRVGKLESGGQLRARWAILAPTSQRRRFCEPVEATRRVRSAPAGARPAMASRSRQSTRPAGQAGLLAPVSREHAVAALAPPAAMLKSQGSALPGQPRAAAQRQRARCQARPRRARRPRPSSRRSRRNRVSLPLRPRPRVPQSCSLNERSFDTLQGVTNLRNQRRSFSFLNPTRRDIRNRFSSRSFDSI
jgi:hypothetical protein